NDASQETPDTHNTAVTRGGRRQSQKPKAEQKPNNTTSQNTPWSLNGTESPNMVASYNADYTTQQNSAGWHNNMPESPNMTEPYTMPQLQNMAAQDYINYVTQQSNPGSLDTSFGGIGLVSYPIG